MDALTKRPLMWITLLAALLRLPTLAIESLWYDETFTAWLANLPLDNLIKAAQGDVHPPTWYLIEWAMVHTLGSHEFSLRLVSALAGIAVVPAVWRLAKILGVSPAKSALVAAVAPFAVYYSQEARMYSLLMLVLTLALIALLEQRWPWFVAGAVFALYLHNLAVLSLAAIGWVGLYRFGRKPQFYVAVAAVGLLWLPWLVYGLLPQASAVSQAFWVRPPTLGTPLFVLVSLFWSEKAILLAWVTVPLLALGLFYGLFSDPKFQSPKVEIIALLLLPIALAVIVSAHTPILVPRIVAFAAIPLYLLLGLGSFPATARPAMAAAPIAVLIAFYGLYWSTDRIGRYPWDFGPTNVVKSTDGIFHANLATYIVYHYYLPNEQFVWRQANDLSQSLTDQTKTAMGMNQASFDDVACRHNRWLLTFYENPTTGPAERAEIARLVKKYHGQQAAHILKNDLVNARIYLITEACHRTARVQ